MKINFSTVESGSKKDHEVTSVEELIDLMASINPMTTLNNFTLDDKDPTSLDYARLFLPDFNDVQLDNILWNCTAYPVCGLIYLTGQLGEMYRNRHIESADEYLAYLMDKAYKELDEAMASNGSE